MQKKYGLVVDLERCTGCQACVIACRMENKLDSGAWIRVETIVSAGQDNLESKYPVLSMQFRPVACMHCEQPPCRDACPVNAISQGSDGIVLIDKERCNGCQECLSACPYQALVYDSTENLVRKCDLCIGRIEHAVEPFCVHCCGYQALFFGNLGDPQSHVSQLLKRRNSYVLRPELATRPAIHYLAPVAPRNL